MKKHVAGFFFALLALLLLCTCARQDQEDLSNAGGSAYTDAGSLAADGEPASAPSFFPLQTYAVYEVYNGNAESDFDRALEGNPLDAKIQRDMQSTDLSGTREQQIFFNSCLQLWINEMEHSVLNLKQRLTETQCTAFDVAQAAWTQGLDRGAEFDRALMQEADIGLGTQYAASSLITAINAYRDRVLHIKYMTMLLETYVEEPIPEAEQLWNTWEITGDPASE